MPPLLLPLAQLVSIVAFLAYGLACFFSEALTAEFKRWGLGPLQRLTGGLEILGAIGLIVGFVSPTIRMMSAGGLALMMICAMFVRAKMRDPFVLWIPAVVLLAINVYIGLS